MEALQFDVRYAAGLQRCWRWVGVWCGMQPYSFKRGCGDGPSLHPLPIQMGLYVVGF